MCPVIRSRPRRKLSKPRLYWPNRRSEHDPNGSENRWQSRKRLAVRLAEIAGRRVTACARSNPRAQTYRPPAQRPQRPRAGTSTPSSRRVPRAPWPLPLRVQFSFGLDRPLRQSRFRPTHRSRATNAARPNASVCTPRRVGPVPRSSLCCPWPLPSASASPKSPARPSTDTGSPALGRAEPPGRGRVADLRRRDRLPSHRPAPAGSDPLEAVDAGARKARCEFRQRLS